LAQPQFSYNTSLLPDFEKYTILPFLSQTTIMRLINTTTIELNEFFDKHIPPYAILSHTWGEDEVTFKDIR
jgi:hypothetical protein